MGIQFVKGLQGDDPKYLKLVATAKHFAVHNGPEPERHSFNVTPNARDLWETYLPAFQDLVVAGGVYSVMWAYNRVDGASASASWMLLEDILRKQWGFPGYVVSDCGAIRDIYLNHKIVNTPEEAAAIGLRRGCDLNCGKVYQHEMLEAVEAGLIDEAEIDLSVYRLMLARLKLGMDIPEFRVESLDAEPGWHDLISWDDVKDGEITYVDDCDGRNVFIYRSGDTCNVYDSRCPHQVTDIPHLALEGKQLTCPKHKWAFNVETGECVAKGTRPLRQFDSRINGGRLEAIW